MRRVGLRENRVGRAQSDPEQECEWYECAHGVTPSGRSIMRQRLPTIAIAGYRGIPYLSLAIYESAYASKARCGQPDRPAAEVARPAPLLHRGAVGQHGQGRGAAWHVSAGRI